MTEPYELSVREAVRLIDRKRLSPVELVDSLLDRIDTLDPSIRSWEVVDREGVRAAAEQATRGLTAELRGMPIGVKDIIDVAGLPTSCGYAPLRGEPVETDAAVVERLRDAGALILGKTVTTQFAYADPPVTRNPWNLAHTPGGSSSGSAAAVAARLVPAALGTQTGGSVLRPAAYCGVVGLKPTFGRVSRTGVAPLSWTLDHVGVLTRSVEDAGYLLPVIAGHDRRDPGSERWQARDFLNALESALRERPRPPRLGVLQSLIDRAGAEVGEHVRDVVQRLRTAGATAQDIDLPVPFEEIGAVHRVIMQAETAAIHFQAVAREPSDYGPKLRAAVETGNLIPAPAYLHARRLRAAIHDEFRRLIRGFDCFLMPTVSNVAPERTTTGDASFQAIWSLTGFPSLTLPTGLSPSGLPIGTQLIAPPFQESTLVLTGRWCATEAGTIGPPPLD